jgi:hypothetical protein
MVYRVIFNYYLPSANNETRPPLRIYLLADFHPNFIPLLEHLVGTGGLIERLHVQFTLIHNKPIRPSHPLLDSIECLKYSVITHQQEDGENAKDEQHHHEPVKQEMAAVQQKQPTRRKPSIQLAEPSAFVGLLQTIYDQSIQSGCAYQPMSRVCADFSDKCDFKKLGFRKFKHMIEEAARHGLVTVPGGDQQRGVDNLSLTVRGFITLLSQGGGSLFAESPVTSQKRQSERVLALEKCSAAMAQDDFERFQPLLYALFDQPAKVWEREVWVERSVIETMLRPFIGPLTTRYLEMAAAAGLISLSKSGSGISLKSTAS